MQVTPELLETVYFELVVSAIDSSHIDPAKKGAAVFRTHGLTKETFESALERYREEPKVWLAIMTRVTERLAALRKTEEPDKPKSEKPTAVPR